METYSLKLSLARDFFLFLDVGFSRASVLRTGCEAVGWIASLRRSASHESSERYIFLRLFVQSITRLLIVVGGYLYYSG